MYVAYKPSHARIEQSYIEIGTYSRFPVKSAKKHDCEC